jgi:hypothetical protein
LARRAVVPALIALALTASGCGGGSASTGATVAVYVAAPLCKGAERELNREAGAVEDLRVRAVCLPDSEAGGRLDLARIGANARRTTADSTAVAYLEGPNPSAAKFSQTIVESADIAWITTSSGAKGMRRVLEALAADDGSSPRDTVRESLGS